jgi:exopolysaccharide biosynthesis predicted pyruvyltransferase EpsI
VRHRIPSGMTDADSQVLRDLRTQTVTTLRSTVGQHLDRVSLIDFPNHVNFGDSLIWRGTVDHLRGIGTEIVYRTDMWRCDFDVLAAQPVTMPILMHGGGNYGDVWPGYQAFREQVVERFPQRPIIQLSQSVWFGDPASAARCNAIMGRHPDYTLLVRDEESLARAKEQLPDVRVVLCPDMALGTDIRARVPEPTTDLVVLARDDREAAFDMKATPLMPSSKVVDWYLTPAHKMAWQLTGVPGALYYRGGARVRRGVSPALQLSYEARASMNVRAAGRILADGRVVITDRLHAHVMCVLLGIPHVVLDNTYGKITALYDSYTHRFSTAHTAPTVTEAAELAEELLAGRPSASSRS